MLTATDWRVETSRRDSEQTTRTTLTKDFCRVVLTCFAALEVGEVARVRPPAGATAQLRELTQLGAVIESV